MSLLEILAIIIGTAASTYGVIELVEYTQNKLRERRQRKQQREQSAAPSGPFRLLNFAHPITLEQRNRVEKILGVTIEKIEDRPLHLDHDDLFEGQVRRTVNSFPLSSEDWQKGDFVVNLPGYVPAAAVLLAELHGRMGHFPTVVRLQPVPDSSPQIYEIAEIMNLQRIRDRAREQR